MDFELSEDQVALQEAMRAFGESRCSSETLHELAETGGPTRQLWQELAEMGVFGLCVPEERGGAGLGWVEAMVVFEELGRSLVPGPLAATFLAAQHLPEAASGEAVVTMLDAEARPVMVEHPDFVDTLAVIDGETVRVVGWSAKSAGNGMKNLAGKDGSGLDRSEDPDSDEHENADPLDPLTPVVRLDEAVFGELLERATQIDGIVGAERATDTESSGEAVTAENSTEADTRKLGRGVEQAEGTTDTESPGEGKATSPAALWRMRGAALVAAQQLGIAAGATASAVTYAQERKQFDKPIGQFQAVKHLCSDMLTSVEVARAAVYFAGALLDDPSFGDAERAVSVARLMASDAANLCGRNCVQIHGGMGYTWEMDAHLYLKRAWVLDMTLASPEEHAEIVAGSLS